MNVRPKHHVIIRAKTQLEITRAHALRDSMQQEINVLVCADLSARLDTLFGYVWIYKLDLIHCLDMCQFIS